jgi:hypothetical protein
MEDGTEVSVKKGMTVTPECDFCKQLVQHLKDIISTNSTEQEVKDTLLGLCSKLRKFGDTCTQIINQYFDEIYSFIVNDLDPDLVCSAFGLCAQGKMPMVSLVPAQASGDRFVLPQDSNSIHWEPLQPQGGKQCLINNK